MQYWARDGLRDMFAVASFGTLLIMSLNQYIDKKVFRVHQLEEQINAVLLAKEKAEHEGIELSFEDTIRIRI